MKLRLIHIDGNVGVGKSTQARFLASAIPNSKILKYEGSVDFFNKIDKMLSEDNDLVLIVDGGMLPSLFKELASGRSYVEVIEKFTPIMHEYRALQHKYSTANLLLLLDNAQEVQNRLDKQKQFNKKVTDPTESSVLDLMKLVNNHTAVSLTYSILTLDADDSMVAVFDKIKKELNKFNCNIKDLFT